MKFARRPPATADVPADQADDTVATPPAPPRGAPVATFAGVLDGRSLWLAIEARSGSLALRDAVSGDVLGVAGDLPEDQPAYRSLRVDLAALAAQPGQTGREAAFDVVLVPGSGRSPKPVWTPPLPPASVPVVDGGRWQLQRTDAGHLRLVREAVPAAAELTSVRALDHGIEVVAEPPGPVSLLNEQGEPVAGFADGVLHADGLAHVAPQLTQVSVGGLPVRRRDNDLTDPGRAVPLPELYAVEPGLEDRVRLRLRWSTDGVLTARVLDPEADQ